MYRSANAPSSGVAGFQNFRGFGGQFSSKIKPARIARSGGGGRYASIVSGVRDPLVVDKLAGGSRGDAETRRHADLHDPGRCTAELRRPSRGDVCDSHAVAPFYSVLVRVNPENPASTTDFVCDVCTEIPEPSAGGRTYAFPIRDDVRFEDGSVLTAYD